MRVWKSIGMEGRGGGAPSSGLVGRVVFGGAEKGSSAVQSMSSPRGSSSSLYDACSLSSLGLMIAKSIWTIECLVSSARLTSFALPFPFGPAGIRGPPSRSTPIIHSSCRIRASMPPGEHLHARMRAPNVLMVASKTVSLRSRPSGAGWRSVESGKKA